MLPSDYRHFVTELGNGGTGPFYGVFPLGFMNHTFDQCPWRGRLFAGDTPEDIPAARAVNAKIIAVGTGKFPAMNWRHSYPDLCCASCAEVVGKLKKQRLAGTA